MCGPPGSVTVAAPNTTAGRTARTRRTAATAAASAQSTPTPQGRTATPTTSTQRPRPPPDSLLRARLRGLRRSIWRGPTTRATTASPASGRVLTERPPLTSSRLPGVSPHIRTRFRSVRPPSTTSPQLRPSGGTSLSPPRRARLPWGRATPHPPHLPLSHSRSTLRPLLTLGSRAT